MTKSLKQVFILSLIIYGSLAAFDIMQYGAIPNSDNVKDHFQNQKALHSAFAAANASNVNRIVRIPAKTFYSMPIKIQNMNNITIQVLGRLSASKNVRFWPRQTTSKMHWNFIQINNCTNIEIRGGGKIDGRGYHWWMILFLNDKKFLVNQDDRPHLINMMYCQNITIHDIVLKNSPQFHLKMDHCHDAQIYNVNIKVNTTAQINLLKQFSLQGLVIMFPFNTDGIDPSGGRMHIYNCTIQNWDDVVVPKPSNDIDCTRDMLVQNIQVVLGVGMSIGSVPPNVNGHCIRNITFRNIYQKRPLKGIYVKTNPGDKGYGNVTDIYYKNFTMDRPIWWAIYIGPQQMKQPDGDGPGCMLYPFDRKGTCQTQPRVTLKNITLQNVKIHKSLLYPITIRCNVTNPCTQINFINVQVDQWQIGQTITGYVCEFATGKGLNNTPVIHCLGDGDEVASNVNDNEQREFKFAQSFNKQQQHQQQQSLSTFNQAIDSISQQLRDEASPSSISSSFKDIYKKLMDFVSTSSANHNHNHDSSHKHILSRMIQQIQKAAHEVGYHDSDDDEFMYDINELYKQFESPEMSLEEVITSQSSSKIYNLQ